MKKIVNKVRLKFFCDNATGDWGTAHHNTIHDYQGFNAFWNGIEMFHDIFEHYFEYEHKYFQGDNAMNIGGEMCAMGHLWYYYNTLEIGSSRMDYQYNRFSNENNIISSTSYLVQEAIEEGYCNFGSTLECAVPIQRRCEDPELDYQLREYFIKTREWSNENEYKEWSEEYKKSVTFRKIANLHRYGYKMAKKLVPNNWKNRNTCREFIEFWNEFCKNNKAKQLGELFRYLDITIYRDGEDIFWKAELISGDIMINDYEIKHIENILETDDYLIYKELQLENDNK